jgi:hypothetical protein
MMVASAEVHLWLQVLFDDVIAAVREARGGAEALLKFDHLYDGSVLVTSRCC